MIRLAVLALGVLLAWLLPPPPWSWAGIAGLTVLAVVPAYASIFLQNRLPRLIRAWTASVGVTLKRFNLAVLGRGPFTWTSSDCQRVVRVVVRRADGSERAAWLCFGSYWFGLAGRGLRVHWE